MTGLAPRSDDFRVLVENVAFLVDAGETAERITRRVGYRSQVTLSRQPLRLGRRDLAAALSVRGAQ